MNNLHYLPYTATSLSVIGRIIFMFLIYKNKSTNSLSLLFCILSIASSSMWIYYSLMNKDMPMIIRSSTEISLLSISCLYIIRNKLVNFIKSERIIFLCFLIFMYSVQRNRILWLDDKILFIFTNDRIKGKIKRIYTFLSYFL